VLVRHPDYEACAREKGPFLAHVKGPYLGHALLVESASSDEVKVVDPLDGRRRTMSQADFEKVWDGTAIHVVRDEE
ncbi:MAG TPA: cysteine peptidase family C39 domain-containing protein, partial [Gemmataceae bacterium]|nr:cysteine peptidase family C39 domain-containing protein [Gemmataceae bacterium]